MEAPCPICGDPEQECWGLYKGLDDGAVTYTAAGATNCPMWVRDLLARIESIETVEQLRECIIWYCDPYPSGGILHLTLEEESYTDEIIEWQLRDGSSWEDEPDAALLGRALGRKLLQFTPEERAYANRWEPPPEPAQPQQITVTVTSDRPWRFQ